MEENEKDYEEDYENEKEIFQEALKMKTKLGLPSIDTALLS